MKQKAKSSDKAEQAAAQTGLVVVPEVVTSIPEFLDHLCRARNDWEITTYRASNDGLYGLLGGSLRLYYHVWDSVGTKPILRKADHKTLKEQLEGHLKSKGLRFTPNTHMATKIVRCVFETDRKRASVYSIVLRAAIEAKIQPDALPAFIRENGGIEQLRLRKRSPIAKVDPKKLIWETTPIATAALAPEASRATNDELQLALVTVQADGGAHIRWMAPEDKARSAMNLALRAFGRQASANVALSDKGSADAEADQKAA